MPLDTAVSMKVPGVAPALDYSKTLMDHVIHWIFLCKNLLTLAVAPLTLQLSRFTDAPTGARRLEMNASQKKQLIGTSITVGDNSYLIAGIFEKHARLENREGGTAKGALVSYKCPKLDVFEALVKEARKAAQAAESDESAEPTTDEPAGDEPVEPTAEELAAEPELATA
jgi:hypothetical protein